MAGGPFAASIYCMTCACEGVVTRADRVYEGAEDDQYVCLLGHAFGVDWRRGAPSEPQWPLAPGVVEAIEAERGDPDAR